MLQLTIRRRESLLRSVREAVAPQSVEMLDRLQTDVAGAILAETLARLVEEIELCILARLQPIAEA